MYGYKCALLNSLCLEMPVHCCYKIPLHFNAFLARQQGMVKVTLALESHISWSTTHQLGNLSEPQHTHL